MKNMFIPTLKRKKKKAVSEIIGYILLITFAIVIAGVVYAWLKTYVPKEGIKCPDEVSVYISDYSLDANSKLSLTLKNNGQFSVGGIFIYYSTGETQEIAVNDLSKSVIPKNKFLNPGVILGNPGENSFKPGGEDKTITFDIKDLKDEKDVPVKKIYAIEIIPIRWQSEGTKKPAPVSCADAKTKKVLDLEIIQRTPPIGSEVA